MAKPRQPVEATRRIPRQQRAAETVAAILEGAAQILEAGGLAAFTTNAGAETMNKSTIGFTNARESGDEMADIKRLFTPEFRNRLDAAIQFAPLPPKVIEQVVDKFIMERRRNRTNLLVTEDEHPELFRSVQ